MPLPPRPRRRRTGAAGNGPPAPADRSLIYLAAGLACLLAVAFAGGRSGLAASLLGLVAFAYAFLVYGPWVPPAAAVAAMAAAWPLSLALRRKPGWKAGVAAAGAALAAFSVLGPAEGLF